MTLADPRENYICGLDTNGFHQVHYVEWGEPENPKVIICVHGLTRNGRDFDYIASQLAQDYRVVCPDMPGRGKSDWLTCKSEYNYSVYIADIAILIGRLGVSRIDWIGTSMGGLIGMFIAALPSSPIQRLIVNDIGPLIENSALQRIFEYVARNPKFENIAEAEQYLRQIHVSFGALTDSQWTHLAQHSARQLADGSYRLHYDPDIAEAFKSAPGGAINLWETWDKINIPVLIIKGAESDLLSYDTAIEMLERRQNSELVEFPDVGHAPPLMSNVQISAIKKWFDTKMPY